jgi:hypothetical protein
MKKLVPKHPRTAEFVAQGLYAVNSFKDLEAKISALETKDDRGAAFEVFAEAFLITQAGILRGVALSPIWRTGRKKISKYTLAESSFCESGACRITPDLT